MATIGLDKLFYSKITEDANGNETYATPVSLAKAMTAELSVELAEATLYADDGAAEVVKEFQSGTLSLGVDNIGRRRTLRARQSMTTAYLFPHRRTAAIPWLSVSVQRKQTVSTAISGSTA